MLGRLIYAPLLVHICGCLRFKNPLASHSAADMTWVSTLRDTRYSFLSPRSCISLSRLDIVLSSNKKSGERSGAHHWKFIGQFGLECANLKAHKLFIDAVLPLDLSSHFTWACSRLKIAFVSREIGKLHESKVSLTKFNESYGLFICNIKKM